MFDRYAEFSGGGVREKGKFRNSGMFNVWRFDSVLCSSVTDPTLKKYPKITKYSVVAPDTIWGSDITYSKLVVCDNT